MKYTAMIALCIIVSSCRNEYKMRDDGSMINIMNRMDNHDISIFKNKIVVGGTTVIYCMAPDSFKYHGTTYYLHGDAYSVKK